MASLRLLYAFFGLILALAVSPASGRCTPSVSSISHSNGTCKNPSQRKAWHTLEDNEKQEYLDAVKCLFNSPPKANITGAKNRYDELHWVHIHQSNIIHGVGAFLPWHRYYMRVYEQVLQTECNYTGGQPYWDEQRDVSLDPSLAAASVWGADDLSFGTASNGCVTDGAFANTTLHLNQLWGVANYSSYCLSREYDESYWSWANTSYADACMATTNYSDAWQCWVAKPHSSAHLAVGGTLSDQAGSPGDPLFFLHHANLDRLWWKWQSQDLETRLVEMNGQSIPSLSDLTTNGWLFPSSSVMDYDNDEYNTTTLNHNLWMVGIVPNTTIAEVMDIRGETICAEYIEAQ
ncbi:hypothetical protein PFICI_10811 [Pestalotiopsis fici W106-1]|uniref:Tyrosinase copper-binding domain-containing protein n=1 Tax=Pestalotiopsis fici (strain W106-1 / CGMCC3.15140) TaxID=1229662 RepID=W3WUX2_PESFW|nr:uncharacterized protein PFICI_10811 [Pestalotiopsis fici W106-1]ETS76937.1 hypothetical protein PFICI_10811 [Pestalotiopsis fici W106-1]